MEVIVVRIVNTVSVLQYKIYSASVQCIVDMLGPTSCILGIGQV